MKQKIHQKGFSQIPLLIAIIVSITVISVGSYGGLQYYKTSRIIKEAEQLAKEEKYNEAIEKLEFAQNKWVVKSLGIQKEKIFSEIKKNRKLNEDKSEYNQGIEEFNKGNWEKAKELLSKVSEISPHYQEAKSKIEEVQQRIIEKEVAKTRKEIEEEAQRKITEEETKRRIAEAQLEYERQLTEQQINELQREREESEKRRTEAEARKQLEEALKVGHLLQDYYNFLREYWGVILPVMETVEQRYVYFAATLAKHSLGYYNPYLKEAEENYISQSGDRVSFLEAKKILDTMVFHPYAAGVNSNDSDYEKINKILNFVNSYVHYENDYMFLNEDDTYLAPPETLTVKSGDCEDFSILVSAAFARVGINSAIMFGRTKDGRYHAMVLIQSTENLPLWFYSDLTQYGLPAGKWYIIEPQFTLEEHQQNPDLFKKWDIKVAALVGKTELIGNICNGQYWSPCPSGQKFICPPVGNPYCE